MAQEQALSYTQRIIRAAEAELEEELFRERVEARKAVIKAHRGKPWWFRLFPYKLVRID